MTIRIIETLINGTVSHFHIERRKWFIFWTAIKNSIFSLQKSNGKWIAREFPTIESINNALNVYTNHPKVIKRIVAQKKL